MLFFLQLRKSISMPPFLYFIIVCSGKETVFLIVCFMSPFFIRCAVTYCKSKSAQMSIKRALFSLSLSDTALNRRLQNSLKSEIPSAQVFEEGGRGRNFCKSFSPPKILFSLKIHRHALGVASAACEVESRPHQRAAEVAPAVTVDICAVGVEPAQADERDRRYHRLYPYIGK